MGGFMINLASQLIFWLRKKSFFRVVQRTLVMLMPVATVGVYFKLFRDCFFSPDSLIYNILNFDNIMPDSVWDLGNVATTAMVRVTLGIFGVYAAYFAAEYTARLYHKDATMAGISAIIVILFCAYLSSDNRNNSFQVTFYSRLISVNGLLVALITGYIIGQIFHWLGKDYHHVTYENIEQIRRRAWNSLIPMAVSILLGLIFGLIIYYFDIRLLDSSMVKTMANQVRASNNLWTVIPLTMLACLLWWGGIGLPLHTLTHSSNTGAALANLNYALRHGGASNVPYKYLGTSLTASYGLMGDACIALSIAVVILLYTHNKDMERVAKLNLLPVTFGMQNGLAIGLPIILNPLYLIPVVFIPAINELIAAGAIDLHLIEPSVYPVLGGTPGILLSFFGTNGNWPSFLFTVLLFILDIILLVPFVFIGQRVGEELQKYDREAEN